ncbi:hypothetical protein ABL78_8415 [Leptomonas seymouri]|uniref:Uncharacterized protein n=1 Tax=Leptomonas seymouri TaxID=5684 RepID=A0A0N0P261_LEPSE|nr:hypothetical protein ABL78_8415 [Leptomonas seymouri]|eukprot:KPI82576.1 hypothetical protein ABL78_8415 [Leptomonas seymouri]
MPCLWGAGGPAGHHRSPRLTPMSGFEMDSPATRLLEENGPPPTLERETPRQRPPPPPHAPCGGGRARNVPMGTARPLGRQHREAQDSRTLAAHIAPAEALAGLPKAHDVVATDGSASLPGQCTAAAAGIVRSPSRLNAHQAYTGSCGPRLRSRRTERTALLRSQRKRVLHTAGLRPEKPGHLSTRPAVGLPAPLLAQTPHASAPGLQARRGSGRCSSSNEVGRRACSSCAHVQGPLAIRQPVQPQCKHQPAVPTHRHE